MHKFLSDSSEYCAVATWFPQKFVYEKKWFEETIYLQFADFEVPAPAEYDKVLRISYGDYMQLPPEEERVPHHEYTAYKP